MKPRTKGTRPPQHTAKKENTLLDASGKYSVPDDNRRKYQKPDKANWPRFVIHNYSGRIQ